MELSQRISDFIEVLPLLQDLSKKAMRARHWEEISSLTGQVIHEHVKAKVSFLAVF